jgi:Flp pilus assembly protein TadB
VVESDEDPALRSLGAVGTMARETPFIDGLNSQPEAVMAIPHETYVPFVAAVGIALFFVGLLIKAALVGVLGVVFGLVGLIWWAWKTGE